MSLPVINLRTCPTCQSVGVMSWRTCATCNGLSMGRMSHGTFLYWHYPLERYYLALQHTKRIFNKIRFITVLLIALNFWAWSLVICLKENAFSTFFSPVTLSSLPPSATVLFWLGMGTLCYLYYRSVVEKQILESVISFDYEHEPEPELSEQPTWSEVFRLPRAHKRNIALAFTPEALTALGEAYELADKGGYNSVTPYHLLYTMLSFNRVSNVFIRLGILTKEIQKQLEPLFAAGNSTTGGNHTAPIIGPAVSPILFLAYEEAYNAHQEYVSVTEVLTATVKYSQQIHDILFDLDIDDRKLTNAVEWARIRERLYRQYQRTSRAAVHRSKHGMDRAMTALATPYLNRFSDDVTMLAKYGRIDACVAREKEIEEIFRIVEGGHASVLLVGDYGVGKRTVVEGIAQRMISDDVPKRLQDKRMVRLSIPSLLAGTTPAGAVERLIVIMNEIARARNVILFLHNVQELMGVSAGNGQSLDVADTLADYLSSGNFMTFATTTTEAFAQNIANSKLASVISKSDIREMNDDQAIQVLESRVAYIEYKQQVFFSYAAIEKAVELARKFVHETVLPGNALEIISEAASFTRRHKGVHTLVTAEEVSSVVAEKTKIPVTTVTASETDKLLHLEQKLHERVIGQDEAVDLVANALRRARANIRTQTRPIANFLFLGPTGVGKTELAKTIAEVYFGGENRMVRLDMSEYQDKNSIYRLIGAPGEKGTGVLTEAIRRSPFTLLLLDELEKADPDILNLFLQVMDDGRLTDSTGRVVDFTNVIVIATSNAGTQTVQEYMRQGLSSDIIKDRLLHGDLKQYFRPEFLNRFDGIVLFKPLDREAIKQIAGLMLKQVAKDLETKGITLHILQSALEFLADVGFDPEFGARPMRRALQERIENKLAELLLTGQIGRHSIVEIGDGGVITVSKGLRSADTIGV